jgi:ABC-type Na+ efflux pump permease subunit
MKKVLFIALREFLATAATKGFIIGALVVPAIIGAMIPVIVMLIMNAKGPKIAGEVAVLDKTGQLTGDVAGYLSTESLTKHLTAQQDEAQKAAAKAGEKFGGGAATQPTGQQGAMVKAAVNAAIGPVPQLTVKGLPANADLEREKAPLRESHEKDDPTARLAVAVIDTDALTPREDGKYGAYQLYVRPGLDERVIGTLRWGLRESIKDARFKTGGFDRSKIDSLVTVEAPDTIEVTKSGERGSTEGLTMLLPLVFMILMVLSVMIGGQYLLTTTIEEKSSRVVEVLLSAVSPMQLMAGKILGQMLVGMTLLAIYSGLGVGALVAFNLLDLLGPWKFACLLVFTGLAYLMIASMLAAIGSAVNELREAQSLQTPVMLTVMLPYLLWMPISRDPNSTLATVLSMVPPMSPFVMVMRIASTSPPPVWQIALAMAISAVGAYLCVWLAAKVFRIGLLMYGKPPNFTTLLKWIRMA